MQFRITPISSVAVVGLGVALLPAACSGPTAPVAAPVAATASAVSSTPAASGNAATAVSSGPISIKGAWARSTPGNPNENSAGYAQVTNNATQVDRLVAASVPESFAKTVELHRTVRAGDVMRMEPVQSFEIAPGATLTLEPGGNHIMLLNLPTALKPGTKVPVTLRFERAAPMTVEFEVREATGASMSGASTPGMAPATGTAGAMTPGGMR